MGRRYHHVSYDQEIDTTPSSFPEGQSGTMHTNITLTTTSFTLSLFHFGGPHQNTKQKTVPPSATPTEQVPAMVPVDPLGQQTSTSQMPTILPSSQSTLQTDHPS